MENIPERKYVPILILPEKIEEKYNKTHCSSSNVYYCDKCKELTLEDFCCNNKTKKQTFTKCVKCNYCFISNFYPRQCLSYLRT